MNIDDYKKINFRSGDYTCFFSWEDPDLQDFNIFDVANNHLLSENKEIALKLARIKPGDEILIKGYLATYSNDKGFFRGTSSTDKIQEMEHAKLYMSKRLKYSKRICRRSIVYMK